ncbi:MAG TPA: ABC transporter substrate-binding protein, partial [Hydrogenophaga sp.]|nr:ABC transporter substrate-binding protein [Hydrogenophaga sp.]
MQIGQHTITRREWLVLAGAAAGSCLHPALAQTGTAWSEIEKAAHGQTVYFNAWAGSERTNAYLQWVGAQVQATHGVKLE